MVHPVPFARKIILVASHAMPVIKWVLYPSTATTPLLERHAGSVVRIIDNGHIGAIVGYILPWPAGLKRRFLAVGVARAGRCGTPLPAGIPPPASKSSNSGSSFFFRLKTRCPENSGHLLSQRPPKSVRGISGWFGPKCLRITIGWKRLRFSITTPCLAAASLTKNSSLLGCPKRSITDASAS